MDLGRVTHVETDTETLGAVEDQTESKQKNANSVAFFNNKGGVGKTTQLANLAHMLAERDNKKILLIDCDPQCNLTQLVLTKDQWQYLYSDDAEDVDTVWSLARPLFRERNEFEWGKKPPIFTSPRFNVDVVPGSPKLALVEDQLANKWQGLKQGTTGPIEESYWLRNLISKLTKYDLVFVDVGPSLGALNRSILISVDSFVSPVAADLFSYYSFSNLAEWFSRLDKQLRKSFEEFTDGPESDQPAMISEHEKFDGKLNTVYLGYTLQQYQSKVQNGERRITKSHEEFSSRFQREALRVAEICDSDAADLNVGGMPYMFAMVPQAQNAHAPIAELKSKDGLLGAQFRQRDNYVVIIKELADSLQIKLDKAGFLKEEIDD